MDIKSFLQWLLASGGSVSTASFILERWPWFQKQSSDMKETIFFLVASAISVLAFVVTKFVPQEILTEIGPYFLLVSGIFIVTIIGKMYHKVDKSDKPKLTDEVLERFNSGL